MNKCCPLLALSLTTAYLQRLVLICLVSLFITGKCISVSYCTVQRLWKKSCSQSTLTCVKLQLGFLSELAVSEGVTVSGCSPLEHSGPVDGSKHRHQHSHQGTCKEKEPELLILTEPQSITVSHEIICQK